MAILLQPKGSWKRRKTSTSNHDDKPHGENQGTPRKGSGFKGKGQMGFQKYRQVGDSRKGLVELPSKPHSSSTHRANPAEPARLAKDSVNTGLRGGRDALHP